MQKSRLHRPEATQLAALTRSTGDLDESRDRQIFGETIDESSRSVAGSEDWLWTSRFAFNSTSQQFGRTFRLERLLGNAFLVCLVGKWCNAL